MSMTVPSITKKKKMKSFRLFFHAVVASTVTFVITSSRSAPEASASTVTAMYNTSSNSGRRRGGHHQKQQEKEQQQAVLTSSSMQKRSNLRDTRSNHHRSHRQNHHENCSAGPDVRKHQRRACNLYIWDAPSAILYKWCHHLLKDHIYEGRGGYLFVRFESNSILQLLFPCDQHSPNRCALCGGSFPDHLELWWSRYLYSPFDRHLDKTYNDALNVVEDDSYHAANGYSKRNQPQKIGRSYERQGSKSSPSATTTTTTTTMSAPPSFSFHKRYVTDVSDLVRDVKDPQKISEQIRQAINNGGQNLERRHHRNSFRSRSNGGSSSSLLEKQSSIPPPPPLYDAYRLKRLKDADTSYLVPTRIGKDTSVPSRTKHAIKEKIVDMLCAFALWTVDDMIYVQGIENKQFAKYKRPSRQ